MSQEILSISQINAYIKAAMDGDPVLSSVAVCGEISNYKVYASGHHYFTLKDDSAALRCVMFRGNALSLRFRPDNGMQVLALGRISAYPRDGAYQLYCTALMPNGAGDLHTAFEQLKARLAAAGLFDPAHKKPLPKFPKRICIITSASGAAIHDMLRILNKRYPLCQVYLLPVRVQGAEAPDEISEAIRYANRFQLADLLIVGRGGGSIEDLWAFNDEQVAYAIYESEIPVISAVGHEPDVTISDYVADLRAATPSNAAELAVPDQDSIRQYLDSAQSAIIVSLQNRISASKKHLAMLSSSPALLAPENYILEKTRQLELLKKELLLAQTRTTGNIRQNFLSLTAKLDALSPLKVLSRGYSLVEKEDGTLVHSARQTAPGDTIHITLSSGSVTASVTDIKE